ncbi:MAG TPA: L-histidine N(alpha)-methyltransferase [Solirubrobacteraceae bacterium]
MEPLSQPLVQVDSWLSEDDERSLANDVLDGLTKPFKELAPKHFYDARGSELFEQITQQPEYYPTRTELAILRDNAAGIVSATSASELVELGAGASDKARILLNAMRETVPTHPRRYIPLDVSESVVEDAARTLTEEYDDLQVYGVVADFERHLEHVPEPESGGHRLVALLGGTIGNFPPGTRRNALAKIATLLGPGCRLLLGTDLVKDPRIIEAAYNDAAGITAEFNRNLLYVLNRELGADFQPESFEHIAFYDRRNEWLEMRLRATRAQTVYVADLDLRVEFAAGEELRTEISAKFTRAHVEADLEAAGLELEHWFTDEEKLFAVSMARLAGGVRG